MSVVTYAIETIIDCVRHTGHEPAELLCDHWTYHRALREVGEGLNHARRLRGLPEIEPHHDLMIAGVPVNKHPWPHAIGFRAVRSEKP